MPRLGRKGAGADRRDASFAGGVTFEPAQRAAFADDRRQRLPARPAVPRFFDHVAAQVRSLNLRVIPSQSPSPAMLRENRCDSLITPLPPSGVDIVQKRLLERPLRLLLRSQGAYRAGRPRSAYLAARHITVV